MMDRPMRLPLAFTMVLGLALSAGCANSREEAAIEVAIRFAAAATDDPEQACGLLADVSRVNLEDSAGAPCAQALADVGLVAQAGGTTAVVQGRQALARLGDQAVFLSLFDDGWRVVAADCRRDSDDVEVPWDCGIEGE